MSKLAELRRGLKLSQTEAGKKAGLSQAVVSLVEGRRLVASERYRQRFARAYGFEGKESEFFDAKTGLAR